MSHRLGTVLEGKACAYGALLSRTIKSPAISGAGPATQDPDRVAVFGTGYEVYKGRSAVQFKPIHATFDNAQGNNTYTLQRKGVLLMEAANSSGQRVYDWNNKISFAVSVTEMAQLFLIGDVWNGQRVQLFHDPNMQSNAQGKVRKTLTAQLAGDNQNVMLSFQETEGERNTTVSVPVSRAEFQVLTQMARFLIPAFLGLDRVP